jgi:hypothetical protein
VLAETWQQSGIFLKKMPPIRNSKRQHMDRKRSNENVLFTSAERMFTAAVVFVAPK